MMQSEPEFYAKSNLVQRKDAEVVLRMYGKDFNQNFKPETILDIGCGPGNVTCNIIVPNFPKYTRIVGVDKSAEMIKHATLYFRRDGLSYDTLDILNGQQLEKFIDKHGTFTRVTSFNCFHCIKDHEKALLNIKRLLTDEGEFLITFVVRSPIFVMYLEMAKKPEWAAYMTDLEDFMPSALKSPHPEEDFSRLMKEAGLKEESCMLMNQSYTFDTTDELIDWMKSINPFISRLPKDRVPEYVKDCMKALTTETRKPSAERSEIHTLHYVLLVAFAKRSASE